MFKDNLGTIIVIKLLFAVILEILFFKVYEPYICELLTKTMRKLMKNVENKMFMEIMLTFYI